MRVVLLKIHVLERARLFRIIRNPEELPEKLGLITAIDLSTGAHL